MLIALILYFAISVQVEVRGEVKENKSVVLAELDKLSQIACNAGMDDSVRGFLITNVVATR